MVKKTALCIFIVVLVFLLPGADSVYGGWDWFWLEWDKLLASDGAANNRFGCSVSTSDDYATVGTLGDDNYNASAYVFEFNGTDWRNR